MSSSMKTGNKVWIVEVGILVAAILFAASTLRPQSPQQIKFSADRRYGTITGNQLYWQDSSQRYLVGMSCDDKGFVRCDTQTGAVELHIAIGYNCGSDPIDFFPSDSGLYAKGDHNALVNQIARGSTGGLVVVPEFVLWDLQQQGVCGGTVAGNLSYTSPVGSASVYTNQTTDGGISLAPAIGWTLDFDGEHSSANRNFIITGPLTTPTPTITPGGPTWTPTFTPTTGASSTPTAIVPTPTAQPTSSVPTSTPNPCPPGFPCTPAPSATSTPPTPIISSTLTATPVPSPTSSPTPISSPCGTPSQNVLCINGRWKVSVTFGGGSGVLGKLATAVPLTTDSGWFWFYEASNPEVFVKVLNGEAINGHDWVFIAGLTDQQVIITVDDMVGPGGTNLYTNPPGKTFVTVLDVLAFP